MNCIVGLGGCTALQRTVALGSVPSARSRCSGVQPPKPFDRMPIPSYTCAASKEVGFGIPVDSAARAATDKLCGFLLCGPLYGGPNVGPQGRQLLLRRVTGIPTRSGCHPVWNPSGSLSQTDPMEPIMANTPLSIGGFTVRQHDGLFSLNDLHVASGGDSNQRPGEFVRNDQTQALIEQVLITAKGLAKLAIDVGVQQVATV